MKQNQRIALVAFGFALTACSSSGGEPPTPPADTGVSDTGDASTLPTPLDPVNDPPGDLPAALGHSLVTSEDSPADFSCYGSPLVIARGAPADREFHVIELGGADSDRVGGVSVDLYFDDTFKKSDLTVTSLKSDDKTKNGTFTAKVSAGYISYRFPASPGYLETYGIELDVPDTGPSLPAVANADKVTALSILIAGASFTATKGAGRIVVRIMDCKGHAVMGAHVLLEVDGAVPKITPGEGIRRNYFSDNELPSAGKYTSRSGVVAFLEIPPAAKSIRLVARAKGGDGVIKPIVMRTMPVVGDSLVAATVFPYVAP